MVPVLDWAPGGLGDCFALLYSATIWHMVLAFESNNTPSVRLYTLVATYLPALILHDSRQTLQHLSETELDTVSNRSVIAWRLWLAEAGDWTPLVYTILEAHLQTDPQ